MGRNKLPHRFGTIPKQIWEKLEGKHKQFLFKYDWYIQQSYKIDDEILELEQEIKELKKRKEKCRKRSEQLWVENRHLKEEYSPSFSISKNDKYTRVTSNQKGFNKVGKSVTQLKEERKLINRYWLINVKYKGRNKSIHIGTDKYIKDFLKNNEWIKENQESLEIKDIDNLTEKNIQRSVEILIGDNLYDEILSPNNFFESKIKFTDLVD